MKLILKAVALASISLSLLAPSRATAGELCMYTNKQGVVTQVASRKAIPPEFANSAKCFTTSSRPKSVATPSTSSRTPTDKKTAHAPWHLAAPEEIELGNNLRRESLSTPLGNIELRWPRSVEQNFGATPRRALLNAATAVNKTLRREPFPDFLRQMELEWKIVILDDNLPDTQIPPPLRMGCHPGWMTPPANIYIVGERIAGRCNGVQMGDASKADHMMEEVLIHELAHAVEFYLLRDYNPPTRMRREGFATWFTLVAARQSPVLPAATLKDRVLWEAKQAMKRSPDNFMFSGSSFDYSRAALYFLAVEKSQGVRGVVDTYKRMQTDQTTFVEAITKEMYWSNAQLKKQLTELLPK